MSVYVVTWNLNNERSNYAEARAAFIRQLEGTYEFTKDPGLESVRFISTRSTATEISAHLRQKMDENDKLFISKINLGEKDGWMNKNVWSWINDRI